MPPFVLICHLSFAAWFGPQVIEDYRVVDREACARLHASKRAAHGEVASYSAEDVRLNNICIKVSGCPRRRSY